MNTGPGFEAYLISKKIDPGAFKEGEPDVWHSWKKEFEQIHPNSFTVQKLNLINPIRRKYRIQVAPEAGAPGIPSPVHKPQPALKMGKPMMKPGPDKDLPGKE